MNEMVQAVITANRERQAQARSLNTRAGEKLFTVLSREEMFSWVTERIAGARRVREISNPELLRLPVFDQTLVEKVVRENPDSIEVLGRQIAIEYRDGYQPKVTLKLDSVEDRLWRGLPDEGITLPSGRAIEFVISFGWYDSVSGTDIPKLKVQMRERLNRKQWDSWQKPAIALSDLASAEVVIPDIITAQYGTCVMEGTPLLAYGAVAVKDYRYYSSDPWFEGKWYQNQSEAEAAHAKSVSKLGEIRVEIRQQQELAKAKAEAETARRALQGLSSREGWYDLEYTVRSEVESRRYSYLPSSIEDLRTGKADTEALVAKVEAMLTEMAHAKAAKATEVERLSAGLPSGLVDCFSSLECAVEFWEKVKALPSHALDDHILYGCGRARRRAHLEEVSGDADFFCGADPNDVSVFVADYHLRDGAPKSNEGADSSGVDLSKLFGGNVRIR